MGESVKVKLVEMRGITKRFPGVLANDHVDFSVEPGEIHALLGENGSGKSTLMSILAGQYRPDGGIILVKGKEMSFRSPRDAIRSGIGMVHQHFKLVENFTVTENIILGDERTPFFCRLNSLSKKIMSLGENYGLTVDPSARIDQLSVGEKQRVEILKMLYRGSELLVLDEPTAVLTPQESLELFDNLKKFAAAGRSVVLITHKLSEVLSGADRVTVLRGGRTAAVLGREEITEEKLARLMVGRDINPVKNDSIDYAGDTVLDLQGVGVMKDVGRQGLRKINFSVRKGEIFGIAGVAGNGQRELAEAITGLRWVHSGRIRINGKDITNLSPRVIADLGVSYVPEDRVGMGLVPGLGIVDNIILKSYRRAPVSGKYLIDYKRAGQEADRLVKEFDVKVADFRSPVSLLSGGNLQRLLLAREISEKPSLMVVVYPVRGLDVGATEAIHAILLELRRKGTAILLVSEDLDEIIKLCDRVGVMYEGEIAGVLPGGDIKPEEIGLLMMGSGISREGA
ncbi:MAG: heme ABC transporter ATP-binding protein [Peptococcaceae bacterium BICA1-7]|nr:MAG: heme ABC transporter ATP-binding protein [Peptococcaceae bacterium BICA1-7]HBV96550.1 ABC transporter ATP-binding protein [Desulfotomaculum sp.]